MSRTFWTKLNHDDARLAIDMMDDAEVGRWFRGWLAGAGGKEYPAEKIASWPVEMRTGFRAGCESAEDAAKYSQKQRDRVLSRYRGSTTEDHGNTTESSGSEKSTETLPSNSQHLTANSQHRKATSEKRSTKFVPPTLDELTVYAKEIELADPLKWQAHYQANGWRVGKNPMKDWRASMRYWKSNQSQSTQKTPIKTNGFTPEYYEQGRMVREDGTF